MNWLKRLFGRVDCNWPVRAYYRHDGGDETLLGVFPTCGDARRAIDQIVARRVFETGEVSFTSIRYEQMTDKR
jgi:hypothetical protein